MFFVAHINEIRLVNNKRVKPYYTTRVSGDGARGLVRNIVVRLL